MAQNKFWLVLTEKQAQEKFLTKEYAINDAKELAQKRKKPMYLMECVKVFDVNVNVIETSFEATPEESLAFEARFKAGDRVNHWDRDVGIFVQICEKSHKRCVVNFPCDGEQIVNIDDLTLAEPTTDETPKPEFKFKVGDRVLLDNYLECIVDDYFDETKSYKLSIMGGGYSIVNEFRVTKK